MSMALYASVIILGVAYSWCDPAVCMLTCVALLVCYSRYCVCCWNEMAKNTRQLHKADQLIEEKTRELRQSDDKVMALTTRLDTVTAELGTKIAMIEELRAEVHQLQPTIKIFEHVIERLEDDRRKLSDVLDCKICFDARVDVVWQCGHVTCGGCA